MRRGVIINRYAGAGATSWRADWIPCTRITDAFIQFVVRTTRGSMRLQSQNAPVYRVAENRTRGSEGMGEDGVRGRCGKITGTECYYVCRGTQSTYRIPCRWAGTRL